MFITVLIVLSYTIFLISEKFEMGISGLLALCGAGVLMNNTFKDFMTNR